MNNINLIGIIFIISSIFDAGKYVWQAQAIKRNCSAKGNSRKFINMAWINSIIKFIYGLSIFDIYIMVTGVIAVCTITYCWFQIYLYYPYRKRGLINFRRPNILIYILNSLLPRNIRKKL